MGTSSVTPKFKPGDIIGRVMLKDSIYLLITKIDYMPHDPITDVSYLGYYFIPLTDKEQFTRLECGIADSFYDKFA